MQAINSRPRILCIGGLDPSGGAGLQADIETIANCGGHALSIATCLTVQNSQQAYSVNAVDNEIIQQQAEHLLNDIQISSCKIGVIPNQKIAITIGKVLQKLSDIPVVLDPVMSASHGVKFVGQTALEKIQKCILPNVTVITPNQSELKQLIPGDQSITTKAILLCQSGPEYCLATGADEQTKIISHYLTNKERVIKTYQQPRLPHAYHGSGCTLSSAIAYFLARNLDIEQAVENALHYTMRTLENSDRPGGGQHIPRRSFT
ncbi:MAG: hydroxymethylpyrimidine/phosphomethylpyrimidine kinase [Pseudomonadota bacterium]